MEPEGCQSEPKRAKGPPKTPPLRNRAEKTKEKRGTGFSFLGLFVFVKINKNTSVHQQINHQKTWNLMPKGCQMEPKLLNDNARTSTETDLENHGKYFSEV